MCLKCGSKYMRRKVDRQIDDLGRGDCVTIAFDCQKDLAEELERWQTGSGYRSRAAAIRTLLFIGLRNQLAVSMGRPIEEAASQ